MNQRGQALIETAIIILTLTLVVTVLFQGMYSVWADLVIDRANHKLVLCTLRRRETQSCERQTHKALAPLLFSFGRLTRVQSQFAQEPSGHYRARSEIIFEAPFGSVISKRSVSELQIQRASRRWPF